MIYVDTRFTSNKLCGTNRKLNELSVRTSSNVVAFRSGRDSHTSRSRAHHQTTHGVKQHYEIFFSSLSGLLVTIAHPFIDVILVFQYLFVVVKTIVINISSVPFYFFTIIKTYFENVSLTSPSPVTWATNVITYLNILPFWSILANAIGVGLCFLMLIFFIKAIK